MPLRIIRQDMTKLECDAIVNSTNSAMAPGGGLDAAIHKAAGPKLAAACRKLNGCPTGEVRLTKGFRLPCKYIIHTVGPIWHGGGAGEREMLARCYRGALALAADKHCRSVAVPLIGAHSFGCPKEEVLAVATDCIRSFLMEHEMLVCLVVYGREDYRIAGQLFEAVASYIDDHYVDSHREPGGNQRRDFRTSFSPDGTQLSWEILTNETQGAQEAAPDETSPDVFPFAAVPYMEDLSTEESPDSAPFGQGSPAPSAPAPMYPPPAPAAAVSERKKARLPAARPKTDASAASLRDALRQLDESFQQMLLRKIDEKGMTDAECYKKANVDRKLFSKIRKDVHYRPSKPTALSFAIALELPLPEAKDLLMKAGYALSHSSKFDIIVEYFIQNGNYNIFEINEALFAFDQNLLGA